MLILTRKIGESICIGENVRLIVQDISQGIVTLGFVAPETVAIVRTELFNRPFKRPESARVLNLNQNEHKEAESWYPRITTRPDPAVLGPTQPAVTVRYKKKFGRGSDGSPDGVLTALSG